MSSLCHDLIGPERWGVPPRDRFCSVNGADLHLLEWGDGEAPPILMVHGMRGHARWFTPVGPALANDYRVLSVDLRGHGESSHSPPYGHGIYADDMVALCDALSLERPILIGHSMGGSVMIRAASQMRDRLRALVVVDSGLGAPLSSLRLAWMKLRFALGFPPPQGPPGRPHRADDGRPPRRFHEPEEWRSRYELRPGPSAIDTPLLLHLADHAVRRQGDGSYVWCFDRHLRDKRKAPRRLVDLGAIPCPVILIYGAQSPLGRRTDPHSYPAYFREASRVTLDFVEGAHHHVFLDRPDAFNEVLRARLAELDA